MLATFKEFILPYAIWALVMGCVLVGMLRDARVPTLLLAVLVSLPNLRYPIHEIPLGSQTLNLLMVASLFGRRPPELLGPLLAPNTPQKWLLWTWSSTGELHRDRVPLAPQTWLLWAIFVYSYFTVWTVSFRYGLLPPIDTSNPVLADWKNYVLMMLAYFAAYRNTHSEEDAQRLTKVMIGVLLLMVLQNVKSVIVGENYSHFRRAEGPFIFAGLNSNHFGAFLAHYGVLALAFSMFAVAKWQRLAGAAIYLLSIYPLFYTYSRGAWVAALAGLVVIGLCKKRIIVLGMIVLALSWQSILPEKVVDRIQMTENEEGDLEESAALRIAAWEKAVALFKEKPIVGVGFQGFVFETDGFRLRNVHNFYLQVAAEQGLLGLFLFLLILARAGLSAWRLFRRGRSEFFKALGLGYLACTAAVLVTNIFGDRFSQLAMGTFYFLFLGLVDRCNQLNQPVQSAPAAKPKAAARPGQMPPPPPNGLPRPSVLTR